MRFFIFCASVVLSLSIVSCSSPEEKKMDRVDSLYKVVEVLEDSIAKVSLAKVESMIEENQRLIDRVQNEYKDTIEKEEMFFFYDFKRYRKSITQLKQNIEFQTGQIAYTKTQLENLKEDINNGLIIDEHFKNYFSSEQEAVNRLKETSKSINQWYRGSFKRYDELKKGVHEILEKKE